MILGYARVSKAEEHDPRMQEDALRAAGAERVFAEQASGGRWERPALHRMLDQLRADDVVVVWQLDRLSRSLKDLLQIMARLEEAGAGFRSLTEAIDTTTHDGQGAPMPPLTVERLVQRGGCLRHRFHHRGD